MAKTYNTIPSVATGDVLTATAWNNQATNVNNYRVPPICRVARSTAEATANATWEVVGSWAESIDTDDMWTSANNYIEIQTVGVYAVTFYGCFVANATGDRLAAITLNDTSTTNPTSGKIVCADFRKSITASDTTVSATAIRSFAAADKLRLHIYQNSGGALDFGVAATGFGSMEVAWVGQVS